MRDFELTDEEWQVLASKANDNNGTQFLVAGGIALGLGVAAITAFPPAGLLTTGWLWYEAWRKTNESNRNEEAIDRGLVAHILKGESLKNYIMQHGEAAAASQIEAALHLGYNASHDAEDLLDALPPALPALAAVDDTAWVENLVKQTALIWGNQGGGKSWLARYVVKMKKEQGYKVIVLDPDSNRSEWQGVESYHSWEDIESQIRSYVDELERRLQDLNDSNMGEKEWQAQLQPIALITEEATTYGDFIRDKALLEKFGKLALTKSRKPMMPLTVVAHNNTQTCLFGIKGLYNLVSKMLQVECLAEVDKVSLQPRSTGTALIKLDSSNEKILVKLPTMKEKITKF